MITVYTLAGILFVVTLFIGILATVKYFVDELEKD